MIEGRDGFGSMEHPGDDVRLGGRQPDRRKFSRGQITGLLFKRSARRLSRDGFNGAGANQITKLLDTAREAGDAIESTVLPAPGAAGTTRPICAGSM